MHGGGIVLVLYTAHMDIDMKKQSRKSVTYYLVKGIDCWVLALFFGRNEEESEE